MYLIEKGITSPRFCPTSRFNEITIKYDPCIGPSPARNLRSVKGDKKVVIDLRVALLVKGPACTNTKATGGECLRV